MSFHEHITVLDPKRREKAATIRKKTSKRWILTAALAFCFLAAGSYYYTDGYAFLHPSAASTLGVREARKLKDLPFGEDLGLVKNVRRVNLAHINAPYNASLIEYKDGYLLFFRYDVLGKLFAKGTLFPFRTFLGCVELDQAFKQKKAPIILHTGSYYSEDPRAFKVGEEIYLSYNDLADNPHYFRTIRLAKLNTETWTLSYSLDLDLTIQPVEKNWVPFEHVDEDGVARVYFTYSINPHKILRLPDASESKIEQPIYPHKDCYQKLSWSQNWGTIRGGTPVKLVDGQYLGFFHSSFADKKHKKVFYVMGAYTYEANPPFKITGISKFPILFKSMYDTPHTNSANPGLRCIFPAGFVVENKEGKDLIHISCGENDCGVKIVTLDKETLYQTMEPVGDAPALPYMGGEEPKERPFDLMPTSSKQITPF